MVQIYIGVWVIVKTTIELSDNLLKKAKALAKERGTTLRAIIEESLQKNLSQSQGGLKFKLKDCSVSGQGPKVPFDDSSWATWRAAAYGDRE